MARPTSSGACPSVVRIKGPSDGQATEWRLRSLLGVGGFARVYEAEDQDGCRAACKAIQVDTPDREARARREIDALEAGQSHRHVVGFLGAAHVGSWMFIFQDLQTGDILDEVLSRRGYARERGGEERAQRVVAQLLRALAHLHRRNIVHGDVKPENVLCGPSASDDVQLADFGSALQLDDQACHMLPPDTGLSMGTALYASPEVLRVECVSPASDMWSVGVLTYVLLSGCFPFSSATETLSHRASFAAEPWRSHVSPAGREFIVSLLRHDPTRRLTAEQALQHPWLASAVRCETPPPAAEAVAPPEPHTPTKRARHTDSLWSTDEEGSVHEGKRAKPLPAEPSHVCVSQLSELCAVP